MKVRKKRKVKPPIEFPCVTASQGDIRLALFSADASKLFSLVDINRRDPDKKKGYQRTLSLARVNSVVKYIKSKKPMPLSILVSFDDASLSDDGTILIVPDRKNAGWVIDGQHRLSGAYESKQKLDLPVVAFLRLPVEKQVEQFVTINREAKGVPTSLYYDLLPQLPHAKSDSEQSKERASDIGNQLKRDEASPFFNRIVIMTSPRAGEMSLTNFVRKVAPLVNRKTGKFSLYTELEQRKILDNYFRALTHVFPKTIKEDSPIFFQTIGFGAVINALPTVFDLTLKRSKGFTIEDATRLLKEIDDFNFEQWREMGTGTAAETLAGEELRERLLARVQGDSSEQVTTIKL
jgi:DGQHR domain-containing protein